ncbi:XdhC family protein [Paracoccus methylarcula]|uniref:XdhC family protein n=2 Tax=Paracoccus methylarcula TaxID=72022 RepID=A0A422QZR7_9RHOB|nr:XdhC family protein [Paracoccus methylarcula]
MKQELTTSGQVCQAHPALVDPWEAALSAGPGTVMAVLTQTIGPAYRNPGTVMSIAPDGSIAGALTSGCIEADLILHAEQVRAKGIPRRLRYGQGSPFMDLRLPCGGAIEVMLFLIRDFEILADLSRHRAARRRVSVHLSKAGRLRLDNSGENEDFTIDFPAPTRFVIFGAGPEAILFADLVRSLGYEHVLLSHEDHSLDAAAKMGCKTCRLDALSDFRELVADDRCAALLFYHDHDYEPEILSRLVNGPAYYIGAQGSRTTQANRLARLSEMGVPPEKLARIRGPIGLIPSSRDPKMLAISVLAEVMQAARELP